MRTNSTISTIVKLYEMFCDRRYQHFVDNDFLRNNDLAIYFKIKVSCHNYGFEKDGQIQHRDWEAYSGYWCHLIVHKHHRVYSAITDDHRASVESLIKENAFKNNGNHDSCYRDSISSLINGLYFKVYTEAWDHIPAAHQVAPVAANIQIDLIDLCSDLFKFGIIKRESIEDQEESNHGYFDRLAGFTEIKPKLIFEQSVAQV